MLDDTATCSHRPPCPGCPRLGESGVSAPALRALEALAGLGGAPSPIVISGAPLAYRHRARLSVRGRSASPKLGIFQLESHAIVDIPNCLIHHPLINQVAQAVKRAAKRLRVSPYSDAAHRGDLRGIQVVVERASQSAQLVLIGNAEDPEALRELAGAIADDLGDALHSLWWNGQPERSNAILGPNWHAFHGPEAVREVFAAAGIHFPPGAFGQANLDLYPRIIDQIRQWVPAGTRLSEYYAGTGAIGLSLLEDCESLAINEVNPHSLRGLDLGLAERSEHERARVELFPGPAAERLDALAGAEVVIADPPRKGLDPELREALIASPVERVIYLSCDVASFDRDCRALLASNRYRLQAIIPYALFPQTDHVESLALLTARDSRGIS